MTDLDALAAANAAEIGRALAAGEATASALSERLLARIAAQTSPSFLAVTAERARAEARAADARLAAGRPLSPLDGVPIAWKDLADMAGLRTTAGSALRAEAPPADRDAALVANAARAGMVSLGKLNLAEFAYSPLGQNPHFGTPANPCATDGPRAPGGSSSGAGAAVAAGLVPCALGTDTGGSIRIPAAFCGVVGYKPSERRLPCEGLFPLSSTQDTPGPLARSVLDCALLEAALRGAPGPAPTPADPRGLSILAPEGLATEGLAPAVAEAFERSLSRLSRAGARVRRAPLPALERSAAALASGSIIAFEAFHLHRAVLDGPAAGRVDPCVRARIEIGRGMSASDFVELLRLRAEAAAEAASVLDGALLATPTTPITAPRLSDFEGDAAGFRRLTPQATRITSLGSFLNLPGLAIPNGRDGDGLPTSFLLSAPGGEDARLLRAGLGVEPLLREISE